MMNKQNSKKINSHQRLIAAISLVVAVLLAICVTFAWYTNRITIQKGKIQLGSFNYAISLYDVDSTSHKSTLLKSKQYSRTESDTWSVNSPQAVNMASGSVKYQIVKITNASGFGIKPYEYLIFDDTMSEKSKQLANYVYFKSYKLSGNTATFPNFPSGELTKDQISDYTEDYYSELPDINELSRPDYQYSFGRIENNAVTLDNLGNPVSTGTYEYYLIAYYITGVPSPEVYSGVEVLANPVIAIGQANGPIPQVSGTKQDIYVNNWQELRNAILDANDGDTIYLSNNVEGPVKTNLEIKKAINLNLNNRNLTVHGDINIDYSSAQSRNLTVPAGSNLIAEGNMYIKSEGTFTINGSGSSRNILLGKSEEVNGTYRVTGGELYVDCGLSVKENDANSISDDEVNEKVGFVLNDIVIRHYHQATEGAEPTSDNLVDVTVNGSNTLVNISTGAAVNSVVARQGKGVTGLYIVNHGEIESVNLANVSFPNERTYKTALYVKNYNTINAASIPAASIGYTSSGSGKNFNTRFIDGDGCATSFKESGCLPTGSSNFVKTDVEPISELEVEDSEVLKTATGKYTVYLKDVSANNSSDYELFSGDNGLFKKYNFDVTQCEELTIVTNNGIKLKPEQFYDIRDNFSVLTKLDISGSAISKVNNSDSVPTIPANAMNATLTGANSNNLSEIVLPITPVNIGANAFKGTKIEKITLGSNIREMGEGAFDVAEGYSIEVIWNNSTAITNNILGGFDVNKTTIFMEETLAAQALNSSYTDAWKLNMYENYDYKDGEYYFKISRDGVTTGCNIIYYAGTIQSKDGSQLVPASLTDGTNSHTVVNIGRQAFKKAIINNGVGDYTVNVSLANCLSVGDSAFGGSTGATLQIADLNLGKVNSIGSKAFEYAKINLCEPRANDYAGMTKLGEYAFRGASITEGKLELRGNSAEDRYTPEDYALAGLTFKGSYDTGNAVLDLRFLNSVQENFASGASISADILLNDCGTIGAGAFKSVIEADNASNPTNIVDARNVKAISDDAFYEIECATLKLGGSNTPVYSSIIGKTSKLGELFIDGNFSVNSEAVSGFADSDNNVAISKLHLSSNVTEIPEKAFAADITNNNLTIADIEIDENTTFNIGASAFQGVNFPTTRTSGGQDYYYNFDGVVQIDELAFADSTIHRLRLGKSIEKITNWNFILHCDDIERLWIETVIPENADDDELDDLVVSLGGNDIVANFSSSNTEIDGFKIQVPAGLLTNYIGANNWSVWRNYFGALYREFNSTYEGNAAGNMPYGLKWYYNIIDPSDASKGAQIVKCESYDFINNCPAPLHSESSGTEEMFEVDDIVCDTPEAYEYGEEHTIFIEYLTPLESIVIPKKMPDPSYPTDLQNHGYFVTELGADEDIFEGVILGPTYSYTNSAYESIPIEDYPLTDEIIATLPGYDPDVSREFEVNFGQLEGLKYISAPSLRSEKIKSLSDTPTGSKYTVTNSNELYYMRSSSKSGLNAHLELVKVLPSYSGSNFTIRREVEAIQEGAFEGCTSITSIDLQAPVAGNNQTNFSPRLNYIEAGAFDGADNLKTFDFTNVRQFVQIGKDVFGSARKLVVNSSGYYQYTPITGIEIKIPSTSASSGAVYNTNLDFKNAGSYYFYNYYGLLIDVNVDGSSGSSVNSNINQSKKLTLKNNEFDETLAGINYHLMTSGTEYADNIYSSKSTQFIAVVTGLSGETAASSTVIIPSTVVVKGVSYEVVAITDSAFGNNESIETLVLPNKNVSYSSAALAGCTNLGIIQYNDVIPFAENANTVAALPTPSAQSLIENSSDEEKKG